MTGVSAGVQRIAFEADVDGSAIEGEFLRLIEVDAEGLPRAILHFNPEDRSAALEEAHARAAGEVGAGSAS